MNGNHLSFEGNLVNRLHETDAGKAPVLELRVGPKGTQYLRFALARSYLRGTKEEVTFLDCVVFGDQAKNLFDSASKGMRLFVEGHINQSFWKTADGQDRSKLECIADTVAPVLRWASASVTKNARPVPVAAPTETAIEIESAQADDAPVVEPELVEPSGEVVIDLDEAPF